MTAQPQAREHFEPVDVKIDPRGRVALLNAGIEPGRTYRAELLGDGSDRMILTPLATVGASR